MRLLRQSVDFTRPPVLSSAPFVYTSIKILEVVSGRARPFVIGERAEDERHQLHAITDERR